MTSLTVDDILGASDDSEGDDDYGDIRLEDILAGDDDDDDDGGGGDDDNDDNSGAGGASNHDVESAIAEKKNLSSTSSITAQPQLSSIGVTSQAFPNSSQASQSISSSTNANNATSPPSAESGVMRDLSETESKQRQYKQEYPGTVAPSMSGHVSNSEKDSTISQGSLVHLKTKDGPTSNDAITDSDSGYVRRTSMEKHSAELERILQGDGESDDEDNNSSFIASNFGVAESDTGQVLAETKGGSSVVQNKTSLLAPSLMPSLAPSASLPRVSESSKLTVATASYSGSAALNQPHAKQPEDYVTGVPQSGPPKLTSTNSVNNAVLPRRHHRRKSSWMNKISAGDAIQAAKTRLKDTFDAPKKAATPLSPLAVKRRVLKRRSKKNQGTGSTSSSNQYDGSSNSVPAGIVATSKLEKISSQLFQNAQYRQHGPGLPTVISVHSKYIAIGTSHGLVLVFDHFQEVRIVLGSEDPKAGSYGAVTALDVSSQDDYLIVGYMNGSLKLWDVMSGAVVKSISDAHFCPITGARFWRGGSPPATVSMDQDGRIVLLLFKKGIFSWSYEQQLLLDKQNDGTIVALDVLPQPPSIWPGKDFKMRVPKKPRVDGTSKGKQAQGTADMAQESRVVVLNASKAISLSKLISFSSLTDSFVVTLLPRPRMLFKIPKPENEDEMSQFSCLAWTWSAAGGWSDDINTGDVVPTKLGAVLARGWGCMLELFSINILGCVSIPSWSKTESEDVAEIRSRMIDRRSTFRARSGTKVVAVQWLSPEILLFMDNEFELCVLNVASEESGVKMHLLERISVSNINMVWSGVSAGISQGIGKTPEAGEGMTAEIAKKNALVNARGDKSFQNTFRASEGRLYLLGRRELQVARVQTWIERVNHLKMSGEWIEALLLALDHHSEIHSREITDMESNDETKTNSHRPADMLLVKHKDDADIADLLMEYVDISLGHDSSSQAVGSLTYKIIGEVCIDYCARIRRSDLLFGPIFERFHLAKQANTMVELLLPYVMSGDLQSLSPRVIQTLVEHFSTRGQTDSVERCILRLSTRNMDLDHVVKVCRANKLYDALIYVFNRGLMDYTTPLEYVLGPIDLTISPEVVAYDAGDAGSKTRRNNFIKALVYISHTLAGHAYPTGELDEQTANSARDDILEWLSQLSSSNNEGGVPRIMQFLRNDTLETLFMLEGIFRQEDDEEHAEFSNSSKDDILEQDRPKQRLFEALLYVQHQAEQARQKILRDKDFDMLTMFLVEMYAISGDSIKVKTEKIIGLVDHLVGAVINGQLQHSAKELEHTLIKVANRFVRNMVRQQASVSRPTLITRPSSLSTNSVEDGLESENAGLKVAAEEEAINSLLKIVEKPGIAVKLKRVKAILFEQVGDTKEVIDSYLLETTIDMAFAKQVFAYIERRANEFGARLPGVASSSSSKIGDRIGAARQASNSITDMQAGLENLRSTVLSLLPDLTKLDRDRAAQVVLLLFPDQHDTVIQKLQDPWLQFNYLQQLMKVSGLMSYSSSNEGPTLAVSTGTGMTDFMERSGATVTPEMHKLYVKLLCQFEKESVLIYLKSNDQYPIDECLRLCERYRVPEAQAYLLERTGDVHSALNHLMSAMELALDELCDALNDRNRMATLARAERETDQTSPHAFRSRSSPSVSTDVDDILALESMHQQRVSIAKGAGRSKGIGRPYVPPLVRGLVEWQKCEAALLKLVGLCERNSHMNLDNAADINGKLWFTLLDAVVANQHKFSDKTVERESSHTKFAIESLRMVLADFVHVVLTQMNGHVSLPSVLAKITKDHRHQRFREFRSTINGMLENVRYEQSILQTAKQLLADAKYRQVRILHKGYADHIQNKVIDTDDDGDATRRRNISGLDEDGEERDASSVARIRRLQKGRRRHHKAHPPLSDVLKKMSNSDAEDSEDEDFNDGSMMIPHGHLVLELEPKYRMGLTF